MKKIEISQTLSQQSPLETILENTRLIKKLSKKLNKSNTLT